MRKRNIIKISFILIFIVLLSNCKIVFYGIEQGIGQIKIVRKSVPITQILQDTTYADSLKKKLRIVQEARSFAIDSLGLSQSKNYTHMYDQKGKDINWVVFASEKYKIEPFNWKYPVLGKMPYKGYFDYKKAWREAERLRAKGYDVKIRTVAAWSTLGYFRDPILSNSLFTSDGELAELVIHELTHATIYVKGKSQFNENIATFVGFEGAKRFLIQKYGKNSPQYKEYIGVLSDEKKIVNHFIQSAKVLDSLYSSFTSEMTNAQKDSLKAKTIKNIVLQMSEIDFYDKKIPSYYSKNVSGINNAYFALLRTYYMDLSAYDEELQQNNSNLKKYISFAKEKYK